MDSKDSAREWGSWTRSFAPAWRTSLSCERSLVRRKFGGHHARERSQKVHLPHIPNRVIARLLCLLLILPMMGCSPAWKRKFIRKSKDAVLPQPILVLQSNVEATYPPDVRYQAHFAYWKSWHGELLDSLGQIRKRDSRYLAGVISELRSMEKILTGPPAQRLTKILEELSQIQERWQQAPEPWAPSSAQRVRLEQL